MHRNYQTKRLKPKKYPPPKVIDIDVGKTLIHRGRVIERLVEYARRKHQEGFQIIIWSSRGTKYAQAAAERAELSSIATAISKPGFIVDDQGWA